jgi:integrase
MLLSPAPIPTRGNCGVVLGGIIGGPFGDAAPTPPMTVLKRGNSRHWYVQFQIDGRTFIKSARTTSRKAAEQFETQLRSQAHGERYLGHKPTLTFDAALTAYAESRQGTPNHRNLLAHRDTLVAVIRGGKLLDDIRSEDLEIFCRKRTAAGISPQTIRHAVNLVRCACKLAKRQGYRVPDLNFPSVKVGKGRTRYLSPDEERRLLTELDPAREGNGLAPYEERSEGLRRAMQDAYDLVLVLLDTGARYGEIANLEWRQIDLEGRQIRLWRPKVQNESVIFMTDRAYGVFDRRARAGMAGHVFKNKAGEARGYSAIAIRKALRRAGLGDCTIHTLRHTHATRLIQNGLSLYEVRSVLGHSDIKTTMRYAHLEQVDVTAKARDAINRLNVRNSGGADGT